MAPDCYSPTRHASSVTKIAFHATAKEITDRFFKKSGAPVGSMVLYHRPDEVTQRGFPRAE